MRKHFCRYAWTVYKHIASVYVRSYSYRMRCGNSEIELMLAEPSDERGR